MDLNDMEDHLAGLKRSSSNARRYVLAFLGRLHWAWQRVSEPVDGGQAEASGGALQSLVAFLGRLHYAWLAVSGSLEGGRAGPSTEALPTAGLTAPAEAFRRALERGGFALREVEVRVVDRVGYIDAIAPGMEVISTTVKVRTRGPSTDVERAPRDRNREYVELVARIARQIVDLGFRTMPGLSHLAVGLCRPVVHPTMGHTYKACELAVLVERGLWSRILHQNVTAENALKNFELRFRYDNEFRLQEVRPFVAGRVIDPSTSTDLAAIDPSEFELLIQRLLQSMGFIAKLTKQSHDGGVDIEAENPQPIIGGRVLVQCKRYANTIGSSVVRDLYGAVTAAHATKGILVATSAFSADARSFAEGKPLELIDGALLRQLLSCNNVGLERSGGAARSDLGIAAG